MGNSIASWSGYLELVADSIALSLQSCCFSLAFDFIILRKPVSLSRCASSREFSTGNLFWLAVSSSRQSRAASSARLTSARLTSDVHHLDLMRLATEAAVSVPAISWSRSSAHLAQAYQELHVAPDRPFRWADWSAKARRLARKAGMPALGLINAQP
jgi:hypothetical protein